MRLIKEKDYGTDAKIKRFTQKQLFKKITKVKTMLGLGGLHPEKYLEVVPEHKNCVLVDSSRCISKKKFSYWRV